jgi:hypothetical protein
LGDEWFEEWFVECSLDLFGVPGLATTISIFSVAVGGVSERSTTSSVI